MTDDIALRDMLMSDLNEVAALEAQEQIAPWSLVIFRRCLEMRCPAWVATHRNVVVAFALITIAAVECHILNVCVARPYQRRGIGGRLLDRSIECARAAHVARIVLEVRASNVVALALYKKRGFIPLGIRKDYYQTEQGHEDACVLVLECDDNAR